MFYDQMLKRRVEELSEFRYREVRQATLRSRPCDAEEVPEVYPNPPVSEEGYLPISPGYRWTGDHSYWWIRTELQIPASWAGKRIAGRFDFTRTLEYWMGFEALLYVNGKPYQALDINHQEVLLPIATGGETLKIDIRLWGGSMRPYKHQFLTYYQADYGWLDEACDDFYYLSDVVLGTIPMIGDGNYAKQALMQAVSSAFFALDWSDPGSESFYESVYRGRAILRGKLSEIPEQDMGVRVNCIGHTHIDLAWLWRAKHTREKGIRSFTTVDRLMELYPEYIFLQSQPQLYKFIKQDAPDLYEKIKARVAEGKWDADGAMWVEPDCNLTSGESLTRQILLAQQFYEAEFGVRSRCLWLPDVFGYSWALPQILKKCNIPMFITSKISWNERNKMPHEFFWWKGIDGSEVLTYFITTPELGTPSGQWFYTYNGYITPEITVGTWNSFQDKTLTNEVLIPYGFGDGGGGVNRDMLERRRKLEEMPGIPKIVPGTLKDFVDHSLANAKAQGTDVPVWDGELYLEFHRGTYTSHSEIKRWNRKLEQKYLRTETLASYVSLNQGTLRTDVIPAMKPGWEKILFNQFHDVLPGSGIHEIYDDAVCEYKEADVIADEVLTTLVTELTEGDGQTGYTLYNTTGWDQDVPVTLPASERCDVLLADGTVVRADYQDGLLRTVLPEVPALGYVTFSLVPVRERIRKKTVFEAVEESGELQIKTPYYQITLNNNGQISKLYDRKEERDVLPEGCCANVFELYEDKPLKYDAWNIDDFHREKKQLITELTDRQVWIGDTMMEVTLCWKYLKSSITQKLCLYAEKPGLVFETVVDNHQKNQILKTAFPLAIRASHASFDIQYGTAQRETTFNNSWEEAKYETVGQRYADLGEYGYGVSLLNDCKYGYDIHDNVIRMSLVKSAVHPDPEQDQGEICFTYELLPHTGNLVQGGTIREAARLNREDPVYTGLPAVELSDHRYLIRSGHEVEIDALKPSEDGSGLILRFHECCGGRGRVALQSLIPIKGWCETNLCEEPVGEMHEGSLMNFTVTPYDIRTILMKL